AYRLSGREAMRQRPARIAVQALGKLGEAEALEVGEERRLAAAQLGLLVDYDCEGALGLLGELGGRLERPHQAFAGGFARLVLAHPAAVLARRHQPHAPLSSARRPPGNGSRDARPASWRFWSTPCGKKGARRGNVPILDEKRYRGSIA